MNETELASWLSFVEVVESFLGTRKANNYKDVLQNLLDNFQALGINMSIKVHYLHSHLDRFRENLGDVSNEQGERFHQDIKVVEERYQGRWDKEMLSDYCWCLKRDKPDYQHSRKSKKQKFSLQKCIFVMYFLTNYCLFVCKVENNNIIIRKISILILYISHFLFFAIKSFTKKNDF